MKKIIILLVFFFSALFFFPQNYSNVKIFLWDNDRELTFEDPDRPGTFIGYEENFIKSFEVVGFSKYNGNLTISSLLPDLNYLLEYGALFIVCGPRSYSEEIINYEDLKKLKEYLNSGGCLYIEGNDIAHFLDLVDRDFLNLYFNNFLLDDGGSNYSNIDTIFTDSNSTFCNFYKFLYPALTPPDFSVDQLGNYFGLGEPNYYSFLLFDLKGKLYRSTATAYTPPESKGPYYFPGKTVMQTTDFGAFSFPVVQGKYISSDTLNLLVRTAYLRDILRFFSIGLTLIIQDDNQVSKSSSEIRESFSKNGIEYDYISLKSTDIYPRFINLAKYNSVFIFTGTYPQVFILPFDTFNLQVYLRYGGNLMISGENFAQSVGLEGENTPETEFPFLGKYLSLDYYNSLYDDNYFFADTSSFYYQNLYTKEIIQTTPTKKDQPDIVIPFKNDTFVKINYYMKGIKAPLSVGVMNNALSSKTVFFGFPIEYLDIEYMSNLINQTYSKFFNYDLGFNLVRLNEENKKENSKKIDTYGKVYFVENKIFLVGLKTALLIDKNGRVIKKLFEGENDLNGLIKNGIYFIKFNENLKVKSIKILKF